MSRTPKPFAVFGFESTHEALAAERVLKDAGLQVVPIPAPASLGTHCGIALRVRESSSEQALFELRAHDIEPSGIILMDDI